MGSGVIPSGIVAKKPHGTGFMSNEADTCRKYVLPKLVDAGWDTEPHRFNEQVTFTDGRIVLAGNKVRRRPQKRADYLLRYTRDFLLTVVEAKPDYKIAGDGLQQAKEYAEILGLKFAYATNSNEIIEFDFLAGRERQIDSFPTSAELWQRFQRGQSLTYVSSTQLLAPYYHHGCKSPPYYQEIAKHNHLNMSELSK